MSGRRWRLRALDAVDATLGRAVAAALARRSAPPPVAAPVAPERVRRLLVIRPGGLGDAVHLLPLLRALRRRFPAAQLDLLLERRNAGLVEHAVGGRVWLYDRRPPRELWGALRAGYDVVVDTEQSRYLSAVVAFLTRAPVRCGFATNARGRLFTHPVPYDVSGYEADVFLTLYAAISGEPVATERLALPVAEAERAWADAALRPLAGRRVAVIAPGAPIRERQWIVDRWIDVARGLVAEGWTIGLVGAGAERAVCRSIARALDPGAVVDLSGQATIRQTAAVIARAGVYLASDGGLLHVAHALDAPTVALFGATPIDKWAPRGPHARTVHHPLPCAPCTRFGYTPPCPRGVECLQRIAAADVLHAAFEVARP